MQITVTAGILILGCAALASGFYWYRTYREQQAADTFVDAVTRQLAHARAQDTQQAWKDAQETFAYGFETYKYSRLAPYFLAYQSDILLKQGEHEAACHMLDQALSYLSRDNALYYAFAVKLALMQIDAADLETQATGETSLQELAKDDENPLQDMARYYHGLMYFNRQDREAAYQAWHTFVQDPDASAWASQADAKLAYRE